MSGVSIRNVTKNYGGGTPNAVADLNLEIPETEFLCLLGPSGCGKSTTLRMIAGLENLSSGEILIGDVTVDSVEKGVFVRPEDRNMGLVFQNYALWPHMTVEQNIEFGLKIKKVPQAEREKRIDEVSRTLGIEKYRKRYPSEVSGGQQQRVALARMIAVSPRIILLDEPLSNLDAKLRLEMRAELKRIHNELGSTFIFVTHDQWEAMTLATTIAVMNEGRLQQVGKPEDIYERPANRFVAEFVGTLPINIIEMSSGHGNALKTWMSAYLSFLPIDASEIASVGLRPRTLVIEPAGADGTRNGMPRCAATILDIVPTGGSWIVELDVGGDRLLGLSGNIDGLAAGNEVTFTVDRKHVHLFDSGSSRVNVV
ncbi:MAG: ABC transporter ATP-binding protein [Rhodospirillales bacterium]|nr:ABC transporter ATP-binding protein [Rhodospirillales bacterium]